MWNVKLQTKQLDWFGKPAQILREKGHAPGADGVCRVVSKYMPRADAESKMQRLAETLAGMASWEIAICAVLEHILEHIFVEPKLFVNEKDSAKARIHWQQRGLAVLAYKSKIATSSDGLSKSDLYSAYLLCKPSDGSFD